MDSPATPVGLSPPLLSLVLRNEPCYTKGKGGLLRQRVGFTVDRVHRNGLRNGRSRSTLSTTNGHDRSRPRRSKRHSDDDVGDDVITGGGSGGACSPANDGATTQTEDTNG
uniref:Retrotransposon protein, putative, Ty3-gypsy subclass n=2 Tax=Oryza sativa subsp. japonica TaxID=39947 RepID=Q7G3L9_ORYSJ|nr:Unknown protein [Oryza sativa Japonica Group]AAP53181.1 retrotransposon protein, putative, Ty3-gypsy subclass [Oryza sativa Japonica Group]